MILSTRNQHKADEISAILNLPIQTLHEIGFSNEIIENGASFQENAKIKIIELIHFLTTQTSISFPVLILADDSGLEVDALQGAPGIHSARYAGIPSNDQANNTKLLHHLQSVNTEKRGAQFRCVLALAVFQNHKELKLENPQIHFFEGICRGSIGTESSGSNGFGYDPLFYPEGSKRSFAEMSDVEKNQISHRAQALSNLKNWLNNV